MSTKKFTPGPWKAFISDVLHTADVYANDKIICSVSSQKSFASFPDKVSEANARLIAAAPDLYEKLELLLRRIESKQYAQLLDDNELNTVKCLLNKVKGE